MKRSSPKSGAEPKPARQRRSPKTPAPARQVSSQEWESLLAEWEHTKRFPLEAALFPQQLPFAADGARYLTAVTPRRAGKTYAIAAKLLSVAQQKPGSTAQIGRAHV